MKRIAEARKAGMVWSFMTYDIAANCSECHGLAHPKLSGEVLAKMLDAGHPSEPDFELVRYSQGTVRHRFYPPDYSKNAEMSPAELARLFVVGQAAKLVSPIQLVTNGVSESQNNRCRLAQRIDPLTCRTACRR